MNYSLRNLLTIGVLAEVGIFLLAYVMQPTIEETFRFAARYSGRLSAFVFLYTFYQYAISFPKAVKDNLSLRKWVTTFAVLHLIHWGFLATNVYLNNIPLEAVKIAGGALAYAMVVAAPLFLHKVKVPLQMVYLYYVSLVMILTYVARAKGDFEGAEPSWYHFTMIAVFLGACIYFGWDMYRKSKQGVKKAA
ncbi:MAG: hypothetical protein AAF696_05785 [Bacteroidota bacterium]